MGPAQLRPAVKFPVDRHNAVTLGVDAAYNLAGKEGVMDGHVDCCRYEPSLEDLLADEVMEPVLRSAGLERHELRDMMVETARRLEDRERQSDWLRQAEPE
jgi:hypothetical protein